MKRVVLKELYKAVALKRKGAAHYRVGSLLDAQEAAKATMESIKELTADGSYLSIPGFGIFRTVIAPARHYTLKGEKLFVPERLRLKFRVNHKEVSLGTASKG